MILATFNLLSASALNLAQSKKLSFGKDLNRLILYVTRTSLSADLLVVGSPSFFDLCYRKQYFTFFEMMKSKCYLNCEIVVEYCRNQKAI